MTVAIIRYNAGNIHSVRLALQRLDIEPVVTNDLQQLRRAEKIIFPGVGEASSAMHYLKAKGLTQEIPRFRQPFLGICLGMQLMCRHSAENNAPCLNIFPSVVKQFPRRLKVPHMGWNTITDLQGPLFESVDPGSYLYFVHSYYVELNPYTVAQSDYMFPFSAAVQKDNFWATQFHPEKSGEIGEQILKNFLSL